MEDRRITRSQEAIKKSFLELLADKKLEEITIHDITKKANVGRRTFYHHYMDKYDLMEKMIEEHINRLHEICIENADDSTVNSELLWFAYFEEHHDFFSIMLSNGGKTAFRDTFFTFVKNEMSLFNNQIQLQEDEINLELYSTFCASAIVGIIEYYFSQAPDSISAQSFSSQVMKLVDKLY